LATPSSLFVDLLPDLPHRTILIRILGWHFDAVAVLSLGYRAAADRAHRLLSWCLSKAV
jgi:hypothetical protein